MKLLPFLLCWSYSILRVALSPSMPWAPKTIAQQIHAAKADYILSLKANHPKLFQDVDTWFQTARAAATPTEHTEAGHHRTEIRTIWTLRSTNFPPCIKQKNGRDFRQLLSLNELVICGIKPPTRIQFYTQRMFEK